MAALPNTISIKTITEPIVKLTCLTFDCRYNLARLTGEDVCACCNFKHVTIGDGAVCANFELVKEASHE